MCDTCGCNITDGNRHLIEGDGSFSLSRHVGVGDVLVAQVLLDCPGVVAIVGEFVSGPVA